MELVLRAAVMYVVLWGLIRMTGKRELAEMSSFEMVLLIVLGDVVQQGITQEDQSITGATLVAGTLTLLVLATGYGAFRWKAVRKVVDGTAVVVVRDGEIVPAAMRIERLTVDDIVAEARQHGIASLRSIRLGILETDGRFSFIRDDAVFAPDD